MIDSLNAQGLSVGATAGAQGMAGLTSSPRVGDVERFQLALNANAAPGTPLVTLGVPGSGLPSPAVSLTAPASAASSAVAGNLATAADAASVTARAAQAGRRSVGESILDSFRSVANNASAEWGQARQAIMSPSMTATEMLQTQMKLINVSFQIDLIGKGVNKVTTNLEQTLKTQ